MTEVPIIEQTISAVAPVLHRDTINPTIPATQDAFVNSAEAFFDKISDDTVSEINQVTGKIDITVAAINIVSEEINTAAFEVEQAKEEVIDLVATLPEGSISNNTVSETTAWSSQKVVDTFAVTKDLIGFIERTTSTLSFAQNLFTLSTTGTIVYKHAKKYTIASNKTLDISSIIGGFYIAYNPETEALYNATETPSFTDDLLVAYIYRTSADIVIQADERHGAEIDTTWHTSHHLDTGAVWRAGGALTYTLDDDTNVSLDISTPTTIADEDLVYTILHNATPTQNYEQILSTNAKIPVMYIDNNIDFKYRQTVPNDTYPTWIKGGTRAVYNNATLGTLVEASEMNYIAYWLVATNAMKTPVKLIMGRAEHTTEESAASEVFEDYGLPMPEIVPMYKIIIQTSTTFTGNNATVKIKSVYRLTQRESSLQNNLSPTAHNSLSGKDADSQHPMSAISGLEDAIASKLDKDFSSFTDKTTPTDTDILPIGEIGGLIKKLSWASIKSIFVGLAGNQMIDGIKTFSSSPITPTPTSQDNSTKVATTAYVDGKMVRATAVNSTSGTSIDFTGIPSWAKRITIMLSGVSTNGVSIPQVQVGNGTIVTSGYIGVVDGQQTGGGITASITSGIGLSRVGMMTSSNILSGNIVFTNINSNTWVGTLVGSVTTGITAIVWSSTSISLSGKLDRIRLTTANGTDIFNAGQINIMYEG